MRINVDRCKCQRFGQCTISAPDVFRFDVDGTLEYDVEPAEELRKSVEDAVDVCPVQAIEIENRQWTRTFW